MTLGVFRLLPLLLCVLLLACSPLAGRAPATQACAGPEVSFEALAPGLWRVPPTGLESDASSRGRIHNLLLARHEGGLWLLGSGPSPVFARALQCQAQARLGLPLVAVVNPLAKSELVMGNSGLAGVAVWAPEPVAQAMQLQCAGCEERLRARLGPAAVDLGHEPVSMPRQLLQGSTGQLGPYAWRLLQRGPQSTSSVWTWTAPAQTPVHASFGLLGDDAAPPDVSDSSITQLAQALAELLQAAPTGPASWLPDHGQLLGREQLQAQLAYWQLLWRAAEQGVAAGHTALEPPAPPPGAPLPAWWQHPRHALNWQRAWRQAEEAELMRP